MQWQRGRTKPVRKSNDKMSKLIGKNSSKQSGAKAAPSYATDPRNKNENMYTTVLASKTQKRLAGKLMRALERTGEVIVEPKSSVVRDGGNERGCAENTVTYILQERVTGVVVLSSKELDSFLKGDGSVKLQITGEDAMLDCEYMADKFKRHRDVRSKLLLVVPDRGSNTEVQYLQGVDMVHLSDDESTWDKDIVARFMQKISIRR